MVKKKVNKNTKKYQKKLAKRELKRLDKQWTQAIRERDGSKCIICGDDKLINAHHIIPRENKALRHNINNGLTLCVRHHKYSTDISAHKNSFVFFLWLMKNKGTQILDLMITVEESLFAKASSVDKDNGLEV